MLHLTRLPFDASLLPDWLSPFAPQIWLAVLFAALILVAYWISIGAKWLVRFFARRRFDDSSAFVGTSWDLAAPVIQLLVFLIAFTRGTELIGFDFGEQLVGMWPKALSALVIISGAVFLATWLNRSLRAYGERANTRHKVDDTLISFAASIIRYLVLGIAILMALSQFGFAPGSLIAIVGAAGLAIALALQDTLKAVAAGFMLAAFRPFRLGDWVEIAGHEGEIFEITPFTTAIKQADNKVMLMTNDKVWGDAIINHTRQGRRRLDLRFDVHYDTDLDKALKVLLEEANIHNRALSKSETWVGVHALGDWSITLRLRIWVPAREFLQIRADLLKAVKQRFDAENIEIPYPHQVELVREGVAYKLPETPSEGD